MIKTDTAIAQTPAIEESRLVPAGQPVQKTGITAKPDVVEISEECKKRLIMSNLKAALASPASSGGLRGRYNR